MSDYYAVRCYRSALSPHASSRILSASQDAFKKNLRVQGYGR
jgi:hypothetical protein